VKCDCRALVKCSDHEETTVFRVSSTAVSVFRHKSHRGWFWIELLPLLLQAAD